MTGGVVLRAEAPTALGNATRRAAGQLAVAAPQLLAGFTDALPRAVDMVARRLLGALLREGLSTERPAGGSRYAFDRVDFDEPLADPARLLDSAPGGALREELADAAVNLAIAYARAARQHTSLRTEATARGAADLVELAAGRDADEQVVLFERLTTEGHNLHPCGRTRLGWSVPDVLEHDLEAGITTIGFVGVPGDLHIGDDLGEALRAGGLPVPNPPAGYRVQPVHAWQLARVVRDRYAGVVRPLAGELPAVPTAALRTLLLGPGLGYLKVALDIQVTSTRRTISVASTRNGPAISTLLSRLLGEDPDGHRLLLLDETAGAAASTPAGDRDLSAVMRRGLSGRLLPGEVAVPGTALNAVDPVTGRTVLVGLVRRYCARVGRPEGPAAALAFASGYARLLLPALLRLVGRYGIAFEAHLQNCVPTFLHGVPHRLALRDFAGLRIHRGRLAAAGVDLRLWPGSVVCTDHSDVMRAKLGYTALQAHLGELVIGLQRAYGLDQAALWGQVRQLVDEVCAGDDHAFFTAPTLPHKALVRMRLAGAGDLYVPVTNPLAADGAAR